MESENLHLQQEKYGSSKFVEQVLWIEEIVGLDGRALPYKMN